MHQLAVNLLTVESERIVGTIAMYEVDRKMTHTCGG